MSTNPHISPIYAAAFTVVLWAAQANAADLRPSVTVEDPVVRLGDVIADAGEAASVTIAEAPAPGQTRQIPINLIEQVAAEYGIDLTVNVAGRTIAVERTGVALSQDALIKRLTDSFPVQSSDSRLALRLYRNQARIFLPAGFDANDIEVTDLRYQERSGRFSAVLTLPLGRGKHREITVTGAAEEMVSLPVLSSTVEPGEAITRSDVGWTEIRRNRLGRNIITAAADLIGQAPRRRLRTGQPIRLTDIAAPVLVEKGSHITMVVQSGNMTLTATGKALQDGGKGEVIRVLNSDTHRTVEGLVTAAGEVRIRLNNRRDAAALNQ